MSSLTTSGPQERQQGERAPVRADVVEGDPPAPGAHPLDEREQLGGLRGDRALGDLVDDPQPVAGKAEDGLVLRRALAVGDLGLHVDEQGGRGPDPRVERAAEGGRAARPVELAEDVVLAGGREEQVRPREGALRAAGEGLERDGLARVEQDDRLVDRADPRDRGPDERGRGGGGNHQCGNRRRAELLDRGHRRRRGGDHGNVHVVVVGGGILGVAAARQVQRDRPGAQVTVLEKEPGLARHQTGRNSGVVHAGLYYAPGSLKARLCRRGAGLLRAFCAEHGLAYVACGKVVVATRAAELPRLEALAERAAANGVGGLRSLDGDGLRAVEPHARGVAALHSPETAITDFAAVTRALGREVEAAGGGVRTGVEVGRVRRGARGGVELELAGEPRCAPTARSSAPACRPTGSPGAAASRPRRASSRSAASTGSCATTAGRWSGA
jgi:hypothetical protein